MAIQHLDSIGDRVHLLLIEYFQNRQAVMAEAVGVTQSAVSRYVRDKSNPTPAVIDRLVELTGATREWLCEGTGAPPRRDLASVAIDAQESGSMLPVFGELLSGLPSQAEEEPMMMRRVLPTLTRPSRYFVRITHDMTAPRVAPGDYILMDADAEWFAPAHRHVNQLCAIRVTKMNTAVLAHVMPWKGNMTSEPIYQARPFSQTMKWPAAKKAYADDQEHLRVRPTDIVAVAIRLERDLAMGFNAYGAHHDG
jgi:transcriptional regulator with XRE-family HTH domain